MTRAAIYARVTEVRWEGGLTKLLPDNTNGDITRTKAYPPGGAEFDLPNLRSLCHPCHVRKTSARRKFGPGPSVERALRSRLIPFEVEAVA